VPSIARTWAVFGQPWLRQISSIVLLVICVFCSWVAGIVLMRSCADKTRCSQHPRRRIVHRTPRNSVAGRIEHRRSRSFRFAIAQVLLSFFLQGKRAVKFLCSKLSRKHDQLRCLPLRRRCTIHPDQSRLVSRSVRSRPCASSQSISSCDPRGVNCVRRRI
jgi:hypothetical protein